METYSKQTYSITGFQKTLEFQMSAVASMILARKVRVSLPDQSNLVLQSLYQLNDKPNLNQPLPLHDGDTEHCRLAQQEMEEPLYGSNVLRSISCPTSQSTTLFPNSIQAGRNAYSDVSFNEDDFQVSINTVHTKTTSHQTDTCSAHNKLNADVPVLPSLPSSLQKAYNIVPGVSAQLSHPHSHVDLLDTAQHKVGSGGNCDNKTANMPSDSNKSVQTVNSSDSSYGAGVGILSQTRRFGAWLTKATEGGKVQVTRKDLNIVAPNSF